MSAETPNTTGLAALLDAIEADHSGCTPALYERAMEAVLERAEKAEAERDRLAHWKAEALPVLDGLQEIGKALDLPLGTRITGPQALEAIEALKAERDRLAAAVERVQVVADLLIEQGDEHVPGCMGQADCAVCVHADLRSALSNAGRGK